MAKTIKKEPLEKKNNSKATESTAWVLTKQHKVVLGSLLVLFSVALLVAFVSFYIHGQEDQSAVSELTDRSESVQNWLGKFGAFLADVIVYRGFGLASFLFVRLFFLTGIFFILGISSKKLKGIWFWDLFAIIILSVLFGFFATSVPELGGTVGYELNLFLQDYIGKTGTLLTLIFGLIIYVIFKLKLTPERIQTFFEKTKKDIKSDLRSTASSDTGSSYNLEEFAIEEEKELMTPPPAPKPSQFEVNKESLKPTISHSSEINLDPVAKPKPIEEILTDKNAVDLILLWIYPTINTLQLIF